MYPVHPLIIMYRHIFIAEIYYKNMIDIQSSC